MTWCIIFFFRLNSMGVDRVYLSIYCLGCNNDFDLVNGAHTHTLINTAHTINSIESHTYLGKYMGGKKTKTNCMGMRVCESTATAAFLSSLKQFSVLRSYTRHRSLLNCTLFWFTFFKRNKQFCEFAEFI